MRIIGGQFRGTRLASVGAGDTAAHLRPTSDRVRESIFNLLINGGYGDTISDARVLDIFAGTGALGAEAMSRGASFVHFIDDGVKAGKLIRENIATLRLGDVSKLQKMDACKLGKNANLPYDLIFLDPPYDKAMGQQALTACLNGGWLADAATIVWEEGTEQVASNGFTMLDARKYGDTWVHFLEKE